MLKILRNYSADLRLYNLKGGMPGFWDVVLIARNSSVSILKFVESFLHSTGVSASPFLFSNGIDDILKVIKFEIDELTYFGVELDNIESAWSFNIKIEALVSDAAVSAKLDDGRASGDEHAFREAVVVHIYEI